MKLRSIAYDTAEKHRDRNLRRIFRRSVTAARVLGQYLFRISSGIEFRERTREGRFKGGGRRIKREDGKKRGR